jgi:hypothetical protein
MSCYFFKLPLNVLCLGFAKIESGPLRRNTSELSKTTAVVREHEIPPHERFPYLEVVHLSGIFFIIFFEELPFAPDKDLFRLKSKERNDISVEALV